MRDQKNSKESRLRRCMKAPMRFLSKVRDFYIQGITECSGRFPYLDAAMGCPPGQLSGALPRSFSVGSARWSSGDDYRDLVRAASTRSRGHYSVELDLPKNPPAPARLHRSFSFGIGRIDEDKPCDFGDNVVVKPNLYPRSRSYAVCRRSGGII